MLKDGAREGGEPPAAATSLVDGFSVQQELVGVEACHERPKGFAFPIWICPIRLNARPEGLSPNKDPGWHSGKFTVWLGRT